MIVVDRINGQNYAENIVNPALSFNVGTWTVNSGTGTASLDNSDPFEGVTSLEIQNNTPASDITVTNSSQTTTIESTGTYQLSLYLRKKAALQVRTVDVLIYKNAVLLDTQTCVLGSDEADEDKNGVWVRFQSDTSYNFLVNDEVTFQFTLKGVVTADLTSAISIDGVMLNANSRGNVIVPAYSKPKLTPINTGTGWIQYLDNTFTELSPLSILEGATSTFTNNSNTIINPQSPIGVTNFFDASTQKVTPENNGDAYNISLRFRAKGSLLNSYFDVLLDIGGSQGVISRESCIFTRAANTEQRFDVDLTVFTADTFVANGGSLKINAIVGDLQVYDINFLIVRIHKAR